MPAFGKRPSFGEMLLQHLIVFLICIVFPGLTTFVAPATWMSFHRSGEKVSCTTRTCVFFVVPFKVQYLDNVVEIRQRERAGKTVKERKLGRTTDKNIQVDGEGFLQLHGENEQVAEVSVSPASLKSVFEKVNEFLHSNKDGSATIFAIANWKFGAGMGGVLTAFTLLYVVGYTLGFLKFVLKSARHLVKPRTANDS